MNKESIGKFNDENGSGATFAAVILLLFLGFPLIFFLYQWLTDVEDEWNLALLSFTFIIIFGFLCLLVAFWCLTFCLFLEHKFKAKKDGSYVKKLPKEEVKYWSRYHGYMERPVKPKKPPKPQPNQLAGRQISVRVPDTRSTSVIPSPQTMSSNSPASDAIELKDLKNLQKLDLDGQINPSAAKRSYSPPTPTIDYNTPPTPLIDYHVQNKSKFGLVNGQPYHLTVNENHISLVDIV